MSTTQTLDEWFAQADDVLTDWRPSGDAMVAKVSDEDADLPVADSYYEQPRERWDYGTLVSAGAMYFRQRYIVGASAEWQPIGFVTSAALVTSFERGGFTPSAVIVDEPFLTSEQWEACVTVQRPNPQRAALEARRNRNTGPNDRRGIDGHYRRRTR